jgi:hypothetical protein
MYFACVVHDCSWCVWSCMKPSSGHLLPCVFCFLVRKGWQKHALFATLLQSACNSEENPPVRMCIRCILHVWCMIAVGEYGAVWSQPQARLRPASSHGCLHCAVWGLRLEKDGQNTHISRRHCKAHVIRRRTRRCACVYDVFCMCGAWLKLVSMEQYEATLRPSAKSVTLSGQRGLARFAQEAHLPRALHFLAKGD